MASGKDTTASPSQASQGSVYDEAVEVFGAEEVLSPGGGRGSRGNRGGGGGRHLSHPEASAFTVLNSPSPPHSGSPSPTPSPSPDAAAKGAMSARRPAALAPTPAAAASSHSEDSDEDDDGDVQAALPQGTYDPSEFDHLSVPPDVKELFQHIIRYTPQTVDLEYKLKAFVPDFIPAVGDIDAFVKVARPDGASDAAGLSVLDEPCAGQSEPAVLHLQLRAVAKHSAAAHVVVKKVEGAERSAKAVDRWIKDISDLHRSKPPPTVHYSRPMPDVDSLMQEWPAQCEQRLRESGLPSSDVDCSLSTYTDIMCSLLDIPVYESRIESLHVLFSLYSAIKSAQLLGSGDTLME